jgi:serine carboxypeptidase-like clade 1
MFITGESYAGIYIPTLMQEVAKQGVITNIKGVAIGNGCWGTVAGTNCGDVGGHPGTVYKIDAEYYMGRGLISPQLKAAADTACGTEWTDPLGPQCKAAWINISIALGPFNIDNVDDFCPETGGVRRLRTLAEHRTLQQQEGTKRLAAASQSQLTSAAQDSTIGDVQMWCGAEEAMDAWRALPAVRKALHVEIAPKPEKNNFNYKILPLDLRDEYRKLATDEKLRFVIYNGQSDANVPYNGQVQYWATPDAGFSVVEDWAPWYRSGKSASAAGHVRTYTKAGHEFKFVVVSGAGHEVPTYRPAAALKLLTGFVL